VAAEAKFSALLVLQKAGRDSSLISFCPPIVFILTAAILFLFPRATAQDELLIC
jgi:hypothetical protein